MTAISSGEGRRPARTTDGRARPTVLIVDDDPMIHRLIEHVLKKEGMDCVVAEYLQTARQCFAERRPDLCIVDGQLPDGIGTVFCKEVKSSPEPPPVIFYSAYFDDAFSFRELREDIGVDLILHKPLDPWILAMHAVAVLSKLQRTAPDGISEDRVKSYDESIYLKLIDVERLIWSVSKDSDPESQRRALRAILHNIKGSAGLYGYDHASDTARDMEKILLDVETAGKTLTADIISRLRQLMRRLKTAFQFPRAMSPTAISARARRQATTDDLKDVLVVYGDWDFLNVLQHAARGLPLRLHTYDHPFHSLDAIVNGVLQPSAAVLGVHFPGQIDGHDLAAAIRDALDARSIPLFFVEEKESGTVDKLTSIRAGAERVYARTSQPQRLLADVAYALGADAPAAALEVDPQTQLLARPSAEKLLNSWTPPGAAPFVLAKLRLDRPAADSGPDRGAEADPPVKSLAWILGRSFRQNDVVARWAEDDFVLAFKGLTRDEGIQIMSELLEKFRQVKPGPRPPSFSAVVARFPDDGMTLADLCDALDEGLARLAAAGGNRVAPAGTAEPVMAGTEILMVDDDQNTLMMLEYSLKSRGYRHRGFNDGESLLEHLGRHAATAGLILLDVDLPGLNGFEVLERLPSILPRPIPVIMLTGHATEADQVKGLNLGAADYIVKPFSIPVLIQRIRHHLSLPIAARAAS